ncbi:MAG: aldo/keto reductase [Wenzhouxiangellaceae bacterium]
MTTTGATRAVGQRPLGETGYTVSELGLGCASYWARPGFPEHRARAVFEAALDCGITLFDTGGSYAGGEAERRLGRLVKASGARGEALVIATKAGTRADDRGRIVRDFSPDGLIRQVDTSLRRLGLERVGLLQLHGPESGDLTDELRTGLERLRDQGKTSMIGINAGSAVLEQVVGQSPFDVLMPFISVLQPHNVALAQKAAGAGQGVLAAEPLARMRFAPPLSRWLFSASGLWYLARTLANRGPGRDQHQCLRTAGAAPGGSGAQLALAWVLARPEVSCAVFGTTRPEHVRELALACNQSMPATVGDAIAACHRSRLDERTRE